MVYLSANGEVIGQFDERELASALATGKVSPDSFFWREGMPAWRPLRELVLPPRPLRVQPNAEFPVTSPVAAKPEPSASRPDAGSPEPQRIAPDIAEKNPFVPRTTAAAEQPARLTEPTSPSEGPGPKPESPDKPASLWRRLFRKKTIRPAGSVASKTPPVDARPEEISRPGARVPEISDKGSKVAAATADSVRGEASSSPDSSTGTLVGKNAPRPSTGPTPRPVQPQPVAGNVSRPDVGPRVSPVGDAASLESAPSPTGAPAKSMERVSGNAPAPEVPADVRKKEEAAKRHSPSVKPQAASPVKGPTATDGPELRPAAVPPQQPKQPLQAATTGKVVAEKSGTVDKPAPFWKRFSRRQTGAQAAPAFRPEPADKQAAVRPPAATTRLDASESPKPEAVPPAPEAPAKAAAPAISVLPARIVRPPETNAGPGIRRITLPPKKGAEPVSGQLKKPAPFPPAKPSPTPDQVPPPQVRSVGSDVGSGVAVDAEKNEAAAARQKEAKEPPRIAAGPAAAKALDSPRGPEAHPPAQAKALPFPPAKLPPVGRKIPPPQVVPTRPVAPGPERKVAPPFPTPAPKKNAETGSAETIAPAALSAEEDKESSAPKQIAATKLPVLMPAGKPPAATGGPELMLAAAKARGRGGRRGLLVALLLLLLAGLGAAAWWFFPTKPPTLSGEVRWVAADGTLVPAAGAEVYLIGREELAARWRELWAEAKSRAAEVGTLLEEAKTVHREKRLAFELAARISELGDEYNMPDAAELRATRDAAQTEEAAAMAEVEKLNQEKDSFTSAAFLLRAPPDALDQTQADESGRFQLMLPDSVEGLVVLVTRADDEEPRQALGWLVPLAGRGEKPEPVLLTPDNALDDGQIREIAGDEP